MKRATEFVAIAVIAFLALSLQDCASVPVGSQISSGSFVDTFSGPALRGWMAQTGTWIVKGGQLQQTDKSIGGDWAERPKIIANFSVGIDFKLETDFSHESGGSIGIMFRYHDTGQTLFVIFHDGAGIIIGKVDNPKEKESGDWYPYPYDLSKTHKAAIEVHGAKIDVYLDGSFAASNDKWGSAYTSGAIGLSTAVTTAAFDNVTVTLLK
jgi:hypothetical protein